MVSSGRSQSLTFPLAIHVILCHLLVWYLQFQKAPNPSNVSLPKCDFQKLGLELTRYEQAEGDELFFVPLSLVQLKDKTKQTQKQMVKNKQALFTLLGQESWEKAPLHWNLYECEKTGRQSPLCRERPCEPAPRRQRGVGPRPVFSVSQKLTFLY